MQNYEQTDYTQHYIVEALFRLMKEKKFSEISVTEIAKKAGVGRATFYRYFKEKEEVILYYFRKNARIFSQRQRYQARYKRDYYDIILSVFQMLKMEKDFVKTLLSSRLEYLYLDYLNENFAQIESFPKGNGYLPYVYAGALYNVSMEWLKKDCAEPCERLAEAMFTMIFGKDALEAIKRDEII